MENKRYNKKVIKIEILLFVIALVVVILTQLIGTTYISQASGEWTELEDLEKKTIGAVEGSELDALSGKLWNECEMYYVSDVNELPKLVADGAIDAFLVAESDKQEILDQYPELCAMVGVAGTTDDEENVYVIVDTANYAILTSEISLDTFSEEGIRIGGITGSELTEIPAAIYPESEIVSYNSFSDMYAALESGKIDAVAVYDTQVGDVNESYDDIAYITTPLTHVEFGFGMGTDDEGDALKEAFNLFLDEIKESGEYEEINALWSSVE